MIRSSSHTLRFCNTGKRKQLDAFVDEYRRVMSVIIDDIWENGYILHEDGVTHEFNISKYKFDIPKYIDYNRYNIETTLSGRALSSLVTQLVGVIKAVTEKQRRRIYVFDKLCGEGVYNYRLWELIESQVITKPNVNKINPELSSKCADIEAAPGRFGYFLRIKSIGTSFGHIKIPIQLTKHSKMLSSGELKNSFLITNRAVNLRWEIEDPPKQPGRIVGCDQGKTTILSLSDGTTTPCACPHGHTLTSVIDKICRKRKGSKAFAKAQDHRKNIINWSINQLNLIGVGEVRLEEVININYGRRVPSSLRHWTNTLIRDKVEDLCERNGVHFKLQSSTYRSQRCSECGFVHKSNRKGKLFVCSNCHLAIDADINAARNHEQDLPDVPKGIVGLKINRTGFFWLPNGFFDVTGVEIGVPLSTTTRNQ